MANKIFYNSWSHGNVSLSPSVEFVKPSSMYQHNLWLFIKAVPSIQYWYQYFYATTIFALQSTDNMREAILAGAYVCVCVYYTDYRQINEVLLEVVHY